MRILDGKNSYPGWKKFGSGMEKFRIRDKHTGSATRFITLLSPAISWPGISSSLLSPSLCRKIPCTDDTIYFIL
jgi:hypothetical protein